LWVYLNIKNQWSAFCELQTRSQKLSNDFFYHEIKGGLQYRLNKNTSFLVGLGDYTTYAFPGNFKSPAATKEFRLWEQLSLVNNIGRVKIEHRYRVEQRWINGSFAARFRYRFNPIIPLNKPAIVPKTWFVSVFNEFFFTNSEPYFSRNRIFAGFGYQFSRIFTVQGGYLNQYDYKKSDDGSHKNFLQVSFLFTAQKKQSKVENYPNTID
jgi:hypothetical protein